MNSFVEKAMEYGQQNGVDQAWFFSFWSAIEYYWYTFGYFSVQEKANVLFEQFREKCLNEDILRWASEDVLKDFADRVYRVNRGRAVEIFKHVYCRAISEWTREVVARIGEELLTRPFRRPSRPRHIPTQNIRQRAQKLEQMIRSHKDRQSETPIPERLKVPRRVRGPSKRPPSRFQRVQK